MKSWLKEPLLHFLLIGAGLFLLYGWGQHRSAGSTGRGRSPSTQVVISQEALQQLTEDFERTWHREPTVADREILIESLVRDEIYFREAHAAELDRDDGVIRRRMRLKMEASLADVESLPPPTDEELLRYLEQHPGEYGAASDSNSQQLDPGPEREASVVRAELEKHRKAVERDWTAAKQRELENAAYARLRQRYTVVIEATPDSSRSTEEVPVR